MGLVFSDTCLLCEPDPSEVQSPDSLGLGPAGKL